MGITRRQLLSAAVLAPTIVTSSLKSAFGAEFDLKWGSSSPADHPLNVRAAEAIKKIEADTNGRVRIRQFPSGQLGGDADMLSQVRAGALDFFTITPAFLTGLVPSTGISSLGFAYKDSQTAWAAVDGEVGQVVRNSAASANIHIFENFWDFGWRQVSSSTKPIRTVEDLRNFKLRVAAAPLYFSMFQSLGTSPVTTTLAEVYTGLQTKLIEGQENPIGLIYLMKFYEVQKYITLTNHIWDPFVVTTNRRAFNALPADLQRIISHHINEAALKEREDYRQIEANARAKMEVAGIQFLDVERAEFRKKLETSGYYTQWRKKFGDVSWNALEKYCGKLV